MQFYIMNDMLMSKSGNETLTVEAFGKNSLRIRSYIDEKIDGNCFALTGKSDFKPEITVTESSAKVTLRSYLYAGLNFRYFRLSSECTKTGDRTTFRIFRTVITAADVSVQVSQMSYGVTAKKFSTFSVSILNCVSR